MSGCVGWKAPREEASLPLLPSCADWDGRVMAGVSSSTRVRGDYIGGCWADLGPGTLKVCLSCAGATSDQNYLTRENNRLSTLFISIFSFQQPQLILPAPDHRELAVGSGQGPPETVWAVPVGAVPCLLTGLLPCSWLCCGNYMATVWGRDGCCQAGHSDSGAVTAQETDTNMGLWGGVQG